MADHTTETSTQEPDISALGAYNLGWKDAIEWNRDERVRTLAERDELRDNLRSANSEIDRLEQILEGRQI